MRARDTIDDDALALQALAWALADDQRAARLLALTGMDPADLRARLSDPALLAAVLAFLQGHQADLLACAEALAVDPQRLVDAHERLSQ